MNGKPTDWRPANALENTEWRPGGMLSAAYADRERREKRHKFVLNVIHVMIVLSMIGAFMLLASRADAARRFVVKQSSPCANGQCAIQQRPVAVQKIQTHVQQVVAQPVVHHAAVVAQPVCAAPVVHQQAVAVPNIHTQNNWYQVGTEAVMEAVATKAARNVVAEQQFKAQVSGTFQGSISGNAQGLYQQQAAPVQQQWQQPAAPAPQWTPPPEPQPPAQEEPPTFSQTGHGALQEHCAECHSNGKAKGGFSLDSMSGDQFWAAVDRIKDGSMPPANPLADYAKEAVVKELLTRQP